MGPKQIKQIKQIKPTYKNWAVNNNQLCVTVLFVYIRNEMCKQKFFFPYI